MCESADGEFDVYYLNYSNEIKMTISFLTMKFYK